MGHWTAHIEVSQGVLWFFEGKKRIIIKVGAWEREGLFPALPVAVYVTLGNSRKNLREAEHNYSSWTLAKMLKLTAQMLVKNAMGSGLLISLFF